MSTETFLKSVKKFLDKEVRIIKSRSRSPPYPTHLLFTHDAKLYFWNRMPDYFASAREVYKSLACRNLCTVTLLLLCPDTGPAVRILGNIGALQNINFAMETKAKKLNCLSSY